MLFEKESVEILRKEVGELPPLLVILGTGWNALLDEVTATTEIDYEKLFGVKASVPGHAGKLVVGKVGDKEVTLMAGRLHMYEGYTAEEATMPIRVLAECGIKNVVVTAAVGALNPKFKVGDFVVLSDLLTLFLALDNPLKGPKFLDMSEVFDPEMREEMKKILTEQEIAVHEGVYAYYHGPNFETPADKVALNMLGADVVGMSTAPETIQARWLGLNVLGLAFVTNLAFVKHNHEDVMAMAEKESEKMSTVLREFIRLGK